MLEGKKIILGVTGSIAAYKTAILTRLLVKKGAEVQVIMTDAAKEFISPLTLSTLSKKPALSEFTKNKSGEWNNHVELGLWADLILIAPASANTLAKCANGLCDNLLLAIYLSAKCEVMFAPAMDLDMYQHPSTKHNLDTLKSFGNIVLESNSGELASGLAGQGRMQEPEELVAAIEDKLDSKKNFKNKKVVITAGPTYEAIDPVRFIGNHSSGKMGYAIASELIARGAQVTLVSGPTALPQPLGLSDYIPVTTGEEMFNATKMAFQRAHIGIMAAAVADYKPKEVAVEKIKKSDAEISIALEKTIDIAKTLGLNKKPKQLLVGFALETENEESNAKQKLQNKNFDLIVLNSMRDEKATFGHDTNKVSIFSNQGLLVESELRPKAEIAQIIVNEIFQLVKNL